MEVEAGAGAEEGSNGSECMGEREKSEDGILIDISEKRLTSVRVSKHILFQNSSAMLFNRVRLKMLMLKALLRIRVSCQSRQTRAA